MKKINLLLLLLLTLLAFNSFSQSSFGMLVSARVMTEINTATSGDISSTNLIVANDVFIDGELYIERGTEIMNQVHITNKKGVGKPAMVEIDAVSTTDVNGNSVPLSGVYSIEGKSNKAKALGVGLGVGLGTFLVPMLAYMAKKGEDVAVKANTVINEFVVAR